MVESVPFEIREHCDIFSDVKLRKQVSQAVPYYLISNKYARKKKSNRIKKSNG